MAPRAVELTADASIMHWLAGTCAGKSNVQAAAKWGGVPCVDRHFDPIQEILVDKVSSCIGWQAPVGAAAMCRQGVTLGAMWGGSHVFRDQLNPRQLVDASIMHWLAGTCGEQQQCAGSVNWQAASMCRQHQCEEGAMSLTANLSEGIVGDILPCIGWQAP
jgi:hypothetical protein